MTTRAICLYFQVHQPFRLRTYRFFDIGSKHDYFDDYANRTIMRKVAEKCYLPANQIILDLIKEYGAAFKVSFSISGSALDQFEMYAPDVLESFYKLAQTGQVEFLAETNAHSLSALTNKQEFVNQVQIHAQRIEAHFGQKPRTFRNTELIYSDEIGEMVADMGYKCMITEGAKHILGWKSPNYMYCSIRNPKLKILLKNFRLSDDIAFRFSNKTWPEWPLTAEKYAGWLKALPQENETVNLFMDYETFGEHQWAETGIFDFMKNLPRVIFAQTDFAFKTPHDLSKELQPVSPISVPYPISWADEERDVTAWLGNDLQKEAFALLYVLADKVNACNNAPIKRDWLRLQNSDHFYYMCTKWFSDGEVHKYFNPYQGPYEAFINYMNVLSDFAIRVNKTCIETITPDEQVKPEIEGLKKVKIPALKAPSKQKKEIIAKPIKAGKTLKTLTKKGKETLQFDDIIKQSDFILKELAKKADLGILIIAMKKADEEFKDTFLSHMGIRKLKLYEADALKPSDFNSTEITNARTQILDLLKSILAKNKKKK